MAMMFRGFAGPKRGATDAFGSAVPTFGTPPFNPAAADEPPVMHPGMTAGIDMPAPAADPQTGFFQKNGMGVNILGAIADGVATGYGAPPVFGIAKQQNMQRQQRMQDMQAAQQAENQQWIERQIWQRDNPAPRAPHYWETNNGSLATIDPDTGQPRVLYEDPTPKVTWTQVDLPNGQKQLIPSINGQIAGGAAGGTAPAAPPAKPVGRLTPIGGGATPNGSRPF